MHRLKQFFHKLSIRKKMLTILCLVGMLPVMILGISLGINSYRTVLKYREKDMTNTLQQACGIVDYQMYTCQQMMKYFVYNQDVINFLECDPTKKTQRYELYQEVSNTIGALKYQNLIMESVTIYSESIQQSFGNEAHPLEDLYKESWYRDEIRDKEWVFDESTLDLISIYKIPSYSGIELIRENYETQIARKEFEMKALQAQINPHFLYNSLSMINWKAIEAGEEEISQVTLALSAFYRTTLNKGRTWISLRLALQNIQAYVQLQLWMHDNDFKVHYDVDEKLLDYELPSLIFQPFVENALEHGLDIKEDPDHQIWFRIWEETESGVIYVSIRDNGVGMDADTLAHVLEYHALGYGVKNVNDRMKLSFGEAYTIQIKSELEKGTEVLLHFPKVQRGECNES